MTTQVETRALQVGLRDYYELCKPRVVMLMLLTAVVGMLLASPGLISLDLLLSATVGIALCAGSAAAVNQILDHQVDARMARTSRRPIPQGHIAPAQGLLFAVVIGVLGMALLLWRVNALTAWLTLASLLGYALVYTVFLKRATPQNIVIGGLAGAAPPLLGWTAVTGRVDPESLLMVLIIFAWTPPHFWALALHRKEEYAKVEIPMLPVTHGEAYTRLHILLYTVILLVVGLLPFVTGMSGYLYLAGSSLLGARFLYWAWVLFRESRPRAPILTFRYSIIYLMALFVVILADHYLLLMGTSGVTPGL